MNRKGDHQGKYVCPRAVGWPPEVLAEVEFFCSENGSHTNCYGSIEEAKYFTKLYTQQKVLFEASINKEDRTAPSQHLTTKLKKPPPLPTGEFYKLSIEQGKLETGVGLLSEEQVIRKTTQGSIQPFLTSEALLQADFKCDTEYKTNDRDETDKVSRNLSPPTDTLGKLQLIHKIPEVPSKSIRTVIVGSSGCTIRSIVLAIENDPNSKLYLDPNWTDLARRLDNDACLVRQLSREKLMDLKRIMDILEELLIDWKMRNSDQATLDILISHCKNANLQSVVGLLENLLIGSQ